MNYELLKSKKFRTAVIAAITGLLTFVSTKFALGWDIDEISVLLTTLMTPFLLYIGAEGFSEQKMKAVIEENKIRKDISDQVLNSIIQNGEKKDE